MKHSYYALFAKNKDSGVYKVLFLDIPEAISEANSVQETILNAQEVQEILTSMGLYMSTAIVMLLKEIRRTHEYPFKPSAKSGLEEAQEDIQTGWIKSFDSVEYWKEAMTKL